MLKRKSIEFNEINTEKIIFFKKKELIWASYQIIKLVQEKNKEILNLKNENEKLTQKAYFDNLTGLLNRHWIELYLENYFKNSTELSIVLIDLDNLKLINTNNYNNWDNTHIASNDINDDNNWNNIA
jgi:predicted signal transduction protein with EAL and GGDEF domain